MLQKWYTQTWDVWQPTALLRATIKEEKDYFQRTLYRTHSMTTPKKRKRKNWTHNEELFQVSSESNILDEFQSLVNLNSYCFPDVNKQIIRHHKTRGFGCWPATEEKIHLEPSGIKIYLLNQEKGKNICTNLLTCSISQKHLTTETELAWQGSQRNIQASESGIQAIQKAPI